MTGFQRVKLATMIMLLGFLILFANAASSKEIKWESEVVINVWCYDVDQMVAVIEMVAEGDTEEASRLATDTLKTGICKSLPPPMGVYFKPKREHSRYYGFLGKTVVIIEGNIISVDDTLGRQAFVIVPIGLLHVFIVNGKPVTYQEA